MEVTCITTILFETVLSLVILYFQSILPGKQLLSGVVLKILPKLGHVLQSSAMEQQHQ